MHKFVAVYGVPADASSFDEAYFRTHLPLIAQVPGIVRTEVSRVTGRVLGERDLHLMAEMYFEDGDTLRSALKSQEWADAGKNLASIGGLELASMYTAEVLDQA